ncbi:MAG TPA: argininosuccinate lyase [Terriglobales bacterium]|nr:argininosuccinate lyase [Terriglobales bacterium]
MKMWSGRFRRPLDPEFEQWQRSFPYDKRLLVYEIAASGAHARALAKAGILSAHELSSLLEAMRHIELELERNPSFLNDNEAEDVHHFLERRLVELSGEVGLKLHAGRSRNEQIATDLRLFIRASIDELQKEIIQLLEALIAKARNTGDAPMPAHTHLQAAEPVLVAHWLLAYAEMLLRDHARLADCRTRLNLCPLGSGAVAGATLPLDRTSMAQELGFAVPTANSIDATSDRDFAIEFVQALALLGIHLSRWAEEMILFSTREFAFIRLPESYSTGSSAMPQKMNPDALELIRGKAGRLTGAATTLLLTVKGLPLAYNKDLQETQEPVFDAADTAIGCLKTATGVIKECEFDLARMSAAAEHGFMNAMAAATYLASKGVPFRSAHECIGKAVTFCLDRGCELQDLSLYELRQFSAAFDQDFFPAITVASVLGCHDVPGGTAPVRVRAALNDLERRLAALQEAQHAHA